MTTLLFSLLSLIAYGLSLTALVRAFLGHTLTHPQRSYALGIGAAILHGATNYLLLRDSAGLDFSLFKSASLITNIIVAILLLTHRRTFRNLLVVAYPLAALSLLPALLFESSSHRIPSDAQGLLLHIALSVIAYSILSVAAIQALLLHLQNRQLKARVNGRLVRILPPLQTMESVLFELIWAGMILLTLSILSGAIFLEDIFAQHLVHKTAFSILAWFIFAILLAGRHLYGWRGQTASLWTLGGAVLLMLGYLGSKLVLELILPR